MKKLMILGASEPQARLIKAAKEMGYYTIVVSIPGNYPGLQYADKVEYIDIKDKERVLEKAKYYDIDGITSCCFDIPLPTIGFVNDSMHLHGLTYKASEMAFNKMLMKEAFLKFGVKTAKHCILKQKNDLDCAFDILQFPMMIKAVDLAGSVGIFKVENEEDAYVFFDKVMSLTKKDYCIIEEFIDGVDFGAQSLVYNNKIEFILVHGDTTYFRNASMPIGHYVPYELNSEELKETKDVVERSIRALELNNCAINIDLIRSEKGIYMVELTGRAGATNLPELVSVYYGIDYYKVIAMLAVGDNPTHILESIKTGHYLPTETRLLMSEKSGTVIQINNRNIPNDYIKELTLDVKTGDLVSEYWSSKNKIGQVVVTGDDIEKCRANMNQVLSNIEVEVE